MRLFTAIELDSAAAAQLGTVIDLLRDRVRAAAPKARLTWVAVDRLHLTLRFIGQAGDSVAAAVRERLTPPLPVAPFDLVVGGLGTFPERGAPKVVWAGASGGTALASLVAELDMRLRDAGVTVETREYHPHITLARVREANGLRGASLIEGVTPRPARVRVGAITLFESRLSPKGPAYVALQHTPLS